MDGSTPFRGAVLGIADEHMKCLARCSVHSRHPGMLAAVVSVVIRYQVASEKAAV